MRRCVCGRSSQFPLCDGGHKQRNWSCSSLSPKPLALGIISGTTYASLAEKLAYHLSGQVVRFLEKPSQYQKIIILSDGTDLAEITLVLKSIQYAEATVFAIDTPSSLLRDSIQNISSVYEVSSHLPDLWAVISGEQSSPQSNINKMKTTKKIFLSHSTKDHDILNSLVQYLRRHFKLDIFVCSDSIFIGEQWYPKIINALTESDIVLAIHSTHFASSQFCAFEMGLARALWKTISIIGIDNAPLPTFIQDLQANFISDHQSKKPWLNRQETLVDLVLKILSERTND